MIYRQHAVGRLASTLVCSTGTSSIAAGILRRSRCPTCSRRNCGAASEPCAARDHQPRGCAMTATRPLAVARGYLAVHAAEGLRGLLTATIIYGGIASAF